MDVDSVTSFDLESLVHIEQTFYNAGYTDGHAHGRIHGLIEGRALGREKGFEMWEEMGFYEGFARAWRGVVGLKLSRGGRGKADVSSMNVSHSRAMQHIKHLLELIEQFPKVNPSTSTTSTHPDSNSQSDIDIPKLQRQIRSRYKALCSSLGVRPRMHLASSNVVNDDDTSTDADVDPNSVADNSDHTNTGSSIPVWKIDRTTGVPVKKAVTNLDLSY